VDEVKAYIAKGASGVAIRSLVTMALRLAS
jgi:hypothetical protein